MDADSTWLLVGLGNPGREYAHHRHNIGFMVVERWLERHVPLSAGEPWRDKFHGRYAFVSGPAGKVVVLQPLTFMNRCGKSVVAASQFFHVPPTRTIVVHDELDFPFGRVAIKNGGGHGGHNGLRDLVTLLGSADFVRIRTGIGRPDRGGDVSGWVLSNFTALEDAHLPEVLDRAESAVTAVMTAGVTAAMNEFNALPAVGDPTANV